jgi:hypothetical protein
MIPSGITLERNANGVPAYVRIDLKKYGDQLTDFFAANGMEDDTSPYNPEFVAKIKRSQQQVREGKVHLVDLNNIWK